MNHITLWILIFGRYHKDVRSGPFSLFQGNKPEFFVFTACSEYFSNPKNTEFYHDVAKNSEWFTVIS